MPRLGEFLCERGLVTPDQVKEAVQQQVLYGGRLGTNLVELNLLSVDELAQTLSQLHNTPLPSYAWLENPDPAAVRKVSRPLVEKHRFIPLRLDNRLLHVAVMDPHDPTVLDELRFATGCRLKAYVLPELLMHDWLAWLFRVPRTIRYVDTTRTPDRGAQAPSTTEGAATAGPTRIREDETPVRPTTSLPSGAMAGRGPSPEGQSAPGPGASPVDEERPTATGPRIDMGSWSVGSAPPPQRDETPSGAHGPPAEASQEAPPGEDTANVDTANVDTANVDTANVDTANVDTANVDTANVDTANVDTANVDTTSGAHVDHEPSAGDPHADDAHTTKLVHQQPLDELTRAPSVPSPSDATPSHPASKPEAPVHGAAAPLGLAPSPADISEYERQMAAAPDRESLTEMALMAASGFAAYGALLVVHQGMVEGLSGCHAGRTPEPIGGVLVPVSADSEFARMARAGEPRRVHLMDNTFDARMVARLGRDLAGQAAAMFPVLLRGRVVNVLYADNGSAVLSESTFAALSKLAEQIGDAYGQLILRRKGLGDESDRPGDGQDGASPTTGPTGSPPITRQG